MNKKNILIISNYYPPIISIASNRIFAMAKYLDKDIFDISVITLNDNSDTIEQVEEQGIKVIRVPNKERLKRFSFHTKQPYLIHKSKVLFNILLSYFVKDSWKAWKKSSIKYIKNNYVKDSFDFVISSFPLQSSHELVLELKKLSYQFYWIADMRDEMGLNPDFRLEQKKKLNVLENRVYEEAKIVVSVSEVMVSNFKHRSSSYLNKCIEVKNGYDFDIPQDYHFNEQFTISHVGTFYGARKPVAFLKALQLFKKKRGVDDFVIQFVGAGSNVIVPISLKKHIKTEGRLKHSEALLKIKNSDANLVISAPVYKGYIVGKIYEYLAMKKPIIAILDSESAKESIKILQTSKLGFISEFDDVNQIEEAIWNSYMVWLNRKPIDADLEFIKKFHRKSQTKILEHALLNMIKDEK